MEKSYFEDIICAKATPSGASAIAVIRVSGKNSWDILSKIFKPLNKKFAGFKSHRAYYGNIVDKNDIIDSMLLLTFKEGNSFTGEESFELNCHGSEVIVSLIIKILLKNGCRMAEPGEFSKRAFLNGKIKLSEAEAIMDIIHSSTKQSALIAVRQLGGRLTKEINIIKEDVANLLASIEVLIDYPEEDLAIDIENYSKKIAFINFNLENLLKGYNRGKLYREGIQAVLLGKTNAGKSTLFNFLLDDDKAIVSDIHGTTRDYIDGLINIDGFGVRIYDTAGLRDTEDPIEKEGTRRSKELSSTSDIIFYVIDGECGLTEEDKNNLTEIENNKKILIIINKTDIINEKQTLINQIDNFIKNTKKNYKTVGISALKEDGLDDFNNAFISLLIGEKLTEKEDPILTNERHFLLLDGCRQNLINAFEKTQTGLLDLVAFELRECLDKIGEITGEITPQDILNRIFSSFCVGK